MKINALTSYATTFKSTRSERNPSGEATVKQYLRDSVESTLDASAFYMDEFGTLPESRIEQMLKYYKTMHPVSIKCPTNEAGVKPKKENDVDNYKLQSSIRGSWERVRNKLYSGPYFITQNEIPKIKILKECGIESVLALCNDDEYGDNCKNAGMNYVGLNQVGGGSLHPYLIKRNLITDLVNNPNAWVDGRSSKNTSDLKELIKIMNGQNENYPYPIYYGCTQGTNLTSCWTELYNILKNSDTKTPLNNEVVEKLAKLKLEVDDTYRD